MRDVQEQASGTFPIHWRFVLNHHCDGVTLKSRKKTFHFGNDASQCYGESDALFFTKFRFTFPIRTINQTLSSLRIVRINPGLGRGSWGRTGKNYYQIYHQLKAHFYMPLDSVETTY